MEKEQNRYARSIDAYHYTSEDVTKYGEFVSSYFSWLTLDTQKKLAKRMENMTKKE